MSDGASVTGPDEFEQLRRARDLGLAGFRDEDDQPVEAIDFARRKTKLPALARVVKHGDDAGAIYDLELDGGARIPVGQSADLLNPRKVDAALADFGAVIPYYTPKRWRPVAAALLAITEVEDTGSSEAEETGAWIASFTRSHVGAREIDVLDVEDLVRVLEDPDDRPAFRGSDRALSVRLEPLMRHMLMHIGTRASRREVSARLARLGFEREQLSARSGDAVLKARYWKSPADFDPEEAT
jgi:hypothetical protein